MVQAISTKDTPKLPTAIVAVIVSVFPLQGHVSFPTADDGVVHANVYGDGDRGLVLAHGGRFTKESWAPQAPVFAEAGFRVVAIDFRGKGESRGGPDSSDDDVHFDVMAAVRYLHETGATTVAVVGASFGGWATARAAVAAPGEIDRLVLLASSPIDEPERHSVRLRHRAVRTRTHRTTRVMLLTTKAAKRCWTLL